jgi:hypothetical protein
MKIALQGQFYLFGLSLAPGVGHEKTITPNLRSASSILSRVDGVDVGNLSFLDSQ